MAYCAVGNLKSVYRRLILSLSSRHPLLVVSIYAAHGARFWEKNEVMCGKYDKMCLFLPKAKFGMKFALRKCLPIS